MDSKGTKKDFTKKLLKYTDRAAMVLVQPIEAEIQYSGDKNLPVDNGGNSPVFIDMDGDGNNDFVFFYSNAIVSSILMSVHQGNIILYSVPGYKVEKLNYNDSIKNNFTFTLGYLGYLNSNAGDFLKNAGGWLFLFNQWRPFYGWVRYEDELDTEIQSRHTKTFYRDGDGYGDESDSTS